MTTRLDTQPYKGARDFYPGDMRLRQYWEDVSRDVVESFGYEPYDGPLLERAELYEAKSSEEIVREQTYRFTDRGGREVVMRPEMTPTFARMVAAQAGELTYPLRWYSFPNLWRYERPQRGRLREHWQLNCDLVVPELTPAYELEMFRLIQALMRAFGAKPTDYVIRYNHRGLCDQLFQSQFKLQEADVRKQIFFLLDRVEKSTPEELQKMAPKKVLDLFTQVYAFLKERPEPQKVFQGLKAAPACEAFLALVDGVGQLGRFDPTVVRGFEYYTGLVFEVVDTHPDNRRAILGGGRYDNLIGQFSKQQLQGIGFGWGDVTFRDFLTVHGLIPKIVEQGSSVCTVLAGEDVLAYALNVQDQLRGSGIASRLMVYPPEKMFKIGLKNALRVAATHMIIVGAKEAAVRKVVLKDIAQRQDATLSVTDCLKRLKNIP